MNNIELIKELYRSFKEKDYKAFARICSPDLIWHQNPGFPNGSTHYGANEVVKNVFQVFNNEWESFRYFIDEMRDLGDGVLVVGAYEGKHRRSGKTFRSEAIHLYSIQDGKVAHFRQFTDTKVIWDAMT